MLVSRRTLSYDNAVLPRQITSQLRYEPTDRFWLAALSSPLPTPQASSRPRQRVPIHHLTCSDDFRAVQDGPTCIGTDTVAKTHVQLGIVDVEADGGGYRRAACGLAALPRLAETFDDPVVTHLVSNAYEHAQLSRQIRFGTAECGSRLTTWSPSPPVLG
jgi:hypothetical protein